MDNIEISLMSQEHIDGIEKIEKECFSTPWSRASIESELDNPNALFLVAADSSEVLGYIGCILVCGEANITNIAVLAKARRQKIGSRLIKKLISALNEKGAELIFLEVRKSNQAAISLYQKFNFEIAGERKNFYREPCEDAYIMKLTI